MGFSYLARRNDTAYISQYRFLLLYPAFAYHSLVTCNYILYDSRIFIYYQDADIL